MKFTFAAIYRSFMPRNVRDYAEKKIGKLARYFENEPDTCVVFSVEKDQNKVDVTVRAGKMVLRAEQSTTDMFASIDAAVADLERQLRRNKSKREKRRRANAPIRSAQEDTPPYDEVLEEVPPPDEDFSSEPPEDNTDNWAEIFGANDFDARLEEVQRGIDALK